MEHPHGMVTTAPPAQSISGRANPVDTTGKTQMRMLTSTPSTYYPTL